MVTKQCYILTQKSYLQLKTPTINAIQTQEAFNAPPKPLLIIQVSLRLFTRLDPRLTIYSIKNTLKTSIDSTLVFQIKTKHIYT